MIAPPARRSYMYVQLQEQDGNFQVLSVPDYYFWVFGLQ